MKTDRITLPPNRLDEYEHRCPGRVDGEACRWNYFVTLTQDDIDGHDRRRHTDADKAFAEHVEQHHPTAKAQPYGDPR